MRTPESKILSIAEMVAERARLKDAGKRVVFTNGCFDILHAGHVGYLDFARRQGDVLILGMNTDASVQRHKGPTRPIVPEKERARVAAALECVDYVVLFDTDEPAPLIAELIPDVLVKGEDWAHYVSGREVVEAAGGKVVLAPLLQGHSSTNIIETIQAPGAGDNPAQETES